MFDKERNKQEFLHRIDTLIKRDGAKKLKGFLTHKSTDFFDAPYSTDVLAEPGGLCHYCLIFMDVLVEMFHQSPYQEYRQAAGISEETLAIVSLLSGLDKVNYFGQELKNVKTYDPERIELAKMGHEPVKKDDNGEFIWETKPVYVVNDTLPLGSGTRAIAFAQAYIKLKKEELLALRWFDYAPYNTDKGPGVESYKASGLLAAMHAAKTTVQHLILKDSLMGLYEDKYGADMSSPDEDVTCDEEDAPAADTATQEAPTTIPDIALPDVEPAKKEKAEEKPQKTKKEPPATEKPQQMASDEGTINLSNIQSLLANVEIPDKLPFRESA